MEKQTIITVVNSDELTETIVDFYSQNGFKMVLNDQSQLKFKRKSTLLDTWKANPLEWGAEIDISISKNTVLAIFNIDSGAQMNTKEEEDVWLAFIDYFKDYLTTGINIDKKLKQNILKNRRSRVGYFAWTILGALMGIVISMLYKKWAGTESNFGLTLAPFLALLFLRWRVSYVKRNAQ